MTKTCKRISNKWKKRRHMRLIRKTLIWQKKVSPPVTRTYPARIWKKPSPYQKPISETASLSLAFLGVLKKRLLLRRRRSRIRTRNWTQTRYILMWTNRNRDKNRKRKFTRPKSHIKFASSDTRGLWVWKFPSWTDSCSVLLSPFRRVDHFEEDWRLRSKIATRCFSSLSSGFRNCNTRDGWKKFRRCCSGRHARPLSQAKSFMLPK